MGLPVWRSPSPAENRDATKLEATATASARSPIRRRRSSQTSPRSSNGRRFAPTNFASHRRPLPRNHNGEDIAALQSLANRALRQPPRVERRTSSVPSPLMPPAPELSEDAARQHEHNLDILALEREHARLNRQRDELRRDFRERNGDTDDDSASGRFRRRAMAILDSRVDWENHPIMGVQARRTAETERRSTQSRRHAPRSDPAASSHLLLSRGESQHRSSDPYLYNPRYPTRGSPPSESYEENAESWLPHPNGRLPSLPVNVERGSDRGSAPPPPAASRPLPYTTWDYTHLRQGIESSASPPPHGAVRPTGTATTGPERLVSGDYFPPLRRMGSRPAEPPQRLTRVAPLPSSNLRESWSPASPVDGLGDRARSFSPDDNWDTMLSTIAPDTTLPSAESSFTSAAASASFSAPRSASADSSSHSAASHSASSSRTHLTIPSRSDDWTCETDEENEMLESLESLESELERHRSYARRLENPSSIPGTSRWGTGWRTTPAGTSSWRESSHEARPDRPSARDLADQMIDRRHDSTDQLMSGAGEQSTADPDLEQMRGVLERLASRDDIPDEMWISAGLNPALARSLDLFNQGSRSFRDRQDRTRERL